MDIVAFESTSVNMSDNMEIAVGSRRFDLRSVVNTVDFAFKSTRSHFTLARVQHWVTGGCLAATIAVGIVADFI